MTSWWQKSIPHWGDILAIPGFALLIYYFWNIPEKNPFEWLLFFFVSGAFLADIFFTYLYLSFSRSNKKKMYI
jgi:RsiW-degrading membrane proteinase PrsW (M82 family)